MGAIPKADSRQLSARPGGQVPPLIARVLPTKPITVTALRPGRVHRHPRTQKKPEKAHQAAEAFFPQFQKLRSWPKSWPVANGVADA